MSEDFMKHVFEAIGHTARHEREKGNHKKANGWILIGIGILLLPIPIFGLPLIGMGIWKLCKSE